MKREPEERERSLAVARRRRVASEVVKPRTKKKKAVRDDSSGELPPPPPRRNEDRNEVRECSRARDIARRTAPREIEGKILFAENDATIRRSLDLASANARTQRSDDTLIRPARLHVQRIFIVYQRRLIYLPHPIHFYLENDVTKRAIRRKLERIINGFLLSPIENQGNSRETTTRVIIIIAGLAIREVKARNVDNPARYERAARLGPTEKFAKASLGRTNVRTSRPVLASAIFPSTTVSANFLRITFDARVSSPLIRSSSFL